MEWLQSADQVESCALHGDREIAFDEGAKVRSASESVLKRVLRLVALLISLKFGSDDPMDSSIQIAIGCNTFLCESLGLMRVEGMQRPQWTWACTEIMSYSQQTESLPQCDSWNVDS